MMNVLKRISPVFAAILFFSASLFAQDQSTTSQDNAAGDNPQLKASASELVENLGTKITLTEDQKQEITNSIYKYQASALAATAQSGTTSGSETGTDNTGGSENEGTTDDASNNSDSQQQSTTDGQSGMAYTEEWLNSEIENVLDDTQKPQWETVKGDFWNQLRDKMATMQQNNSY
jgi:hypothetical protein